MTLIVAACNIVAITMSWWVLLLVVEGLGKHLFMCDQLRFLPRAQLSAICVGHKSVPQPLRAAIVLMYLCPVRCSVSWLFDSAALVLKPTVSSTLPANLQPQNAHYVDEIRMSRLFDARFTAP